MPYHNLRDQSIESLLDSVQELAAVASRNQVQSVMALLARCAVEVGDRLAQLSADLRQAQTILGTRLSELTEQLRASRVEMAKASEASSQHTAALVFWTKILVGATIAYTLISGGLLLVAIIRR